MRSAAAEAQAERAEMEIAVAARPAGDLLSQMVGHPAFVRAHRFADMRLPGRFAVGPARLAVSRFYFAAKVVVDVIPVSGRDERVIRVKRAYCAAHGLRYVLLADPYDEQGIREQLARPAAAAVEVPAERAVRRPVVEKRQRARKPRAKG